MMTMMAMVTTLMAMMMKPMVKTEKNESCWLPASAPSHWFHACCVAPVNTAICHKYTLKSKIQIQKICNMSQIQNTNTADLHFVMNKEYTQKWIELKIQIHKICRNWKSKMSIIQNNWIIIQTCFWCRAGAKLCFRIYHSFYILEIENWRQQHPGKVWYFSSQVNLKHLFDNRSSRQKIILIH